MKRIHVLVTGGGGYIGSILVPYLLKRNYKVTVIDRFFFGLNYKKQKYLKIIKDDVLNINESHFKKVDKVIDLVAIANDVSSDYFKLQTIKINYLSRLRTAKIAKKCMVNQYILPSSASIYGYIPNKFLVKENHNPKPLTHYSKNNLKAEKKILNLASSKFHVNVMRQGTIFGYSPRMRLDLVLNNFVYSYLNDNCVKMLRNGYQQRPFLHIKDTSRFMDFLMRNNYEEFNSQIFNVGDSKNNISIMSLKKTFEIIINKKIKHIWYGNNDFRSYKLDFKKINSTGFKCKYDIEYGVKELLSKLKTFEASDINYTLNWYKKINKWNNLISKLSLKGEIFL